MPLTCVMDRLKLYNQELVGVRLRTLIGSFLFFKVERDGSGIG